MGQDEPLDLGVLSDLPDHGRRHVQAPLHCDGFFGHGIVRYEQIRVRRQSEEALTLSCGKASFVYLCPMTELERSGFLVQLRLRIWTRNSVPPRERSR